MKPAIHYLVFGEEHRRVVFEQLARALEVHHASFITSPPHLLLPHLLRSLLLPLLQVILMRIARKENKFIAK